MALEDLFQRRIARGRNRGNQTPDMSVTEKTVSNQYCNRCNRGNRHFDEGVGVEVAKAPPAEKPTHATSYLFGYTVTTVTTLNYKGKSCNRPLYPAVTAVTPSKSRPAPAPGGLVDRVVKAGGKTSIGGKCRGGGLWKLASVPHDIDPLLVAELEADGWSVQGIENMRDHVAETMKSAELAVTKLADEDRGETE